MRWLVHGFSHLDSSFNQAFKADFCNPGLLGMQQCVFLKPTADHRVDDYSTFRRVYETPILKSRAPGSTAKETEIGEARSAQACRPPCHHISNEG